MNSTAMTLVPTQATEVATFGQVIQTYVALAGQIAKTEFVPESYRNRPEAILACFLKGRELGLDPFQSLESIDVIKGRPGLKPEAMRGLVQAAGHRIWPDTYTDTKVTMCGARKDDPERVESVTWTLDDAKRAELTSNATWKKYPRAMLTARATSELCRLMFSDVIKGLSYTPEEVESFVIDTPSRTVSSLPDPPAVEAETVGVLPNLATDAERDAVNARLATLDTEMTDEAKRLWKAEVGPPFKSVERFTGEHAAKALALCDAVEKEVFARRRRHVYAVLGEIEKHTGEKIADEDRHAIVSSATNGATESTGRLSEAQLAAVLDQLAPLRPPTEAA